jgi:restriction system protein
MTIPTYDRLIQPVLDVLVRHPEGVAFATVRDEVATAVGVTADERKQLLPSGRYPVFANRVGWAHDRLKRVGLSHSMKRGVWCLTEAGRELVARHGAALSEDQITTIAKASRGSTVAVPMSLQGLAAPASATAAAAVSTTAESDTQTPRDRIDTAIAEWNASIKQSLLENICASSPAFFEKLVLDLLLKMGYGVTQRSLTQTGGTGDGGIDGIISLDKLGLEKVYIQAKRYTSTSVGSPEIRSFYGALAERKASKGVFITSSSFSAPAQATAERLSDNIVLVDGDQLAEHMIAHEVGCTVQHVVRVVDVDTDYFDDPT